MREYEQDTVYICVYPKADGVEKILISLAKELSKELTNSNIRISELSERVKELEDGRR